MHSSKTCRKDNIQSLFFFILVIVFSIITITQESIAESITENVEYIINDAFKIKLYKDPQWLKLLHYQKNSFSKSFYSDIDGTKFFNSVNGSRNPRTELIATIKALHSTRKKDVRDVNQHPQCRFPARLSWLKDILPSFSDELPTIRCKKFLTWRHFLNSESLSLIYVSPSADNSGSIFGNTFLKINPPKLHKNVFNKDKNLLPTKAVSYDINPSELQKKEWFYSIKTVFGKYPGKLTVEPYIKRIARFPSNEYRDIWEYELNLTPYETTQLLEHVWELQQAKINYYFFDENSSYLLLSLIDVAKPELNLTESFSLQVLPVDTIRLLIKKEVISNIKYIPSPLTNIKYHYSEYPRSQRKMIKGLIKGSLTTNDPKFQKLSATIQVFLIEVANKYLQLSYKREEIDRISYKIQSLRLRKARKKLDPLIELPDAPPPEVRPDQDHKTTKIGIGLGQRHSVNFLELTWRPALHDLLDTSGTYNFGTQTSYLDTAIRLDEEHGLIQLNKLHFINVYSLQPRSSLYKPWSFKYKIGFDRDTIFTADIDTYFNLNGAFGLSYKLAKPLGFYALLEATVVIDKRIDNKISFAAGPNLGFLWQVNNGWKMWLDSTIQYYDKQNNYNIVEKYSLGNSFKLSHNKVIRLFIVKQGFDNFTKQEVNLNLSWYY